MSYFNSIGGDYRQRQVIQPKTTPTNTQSTLPTAVKVQTTPVKPTFVEPTITQEQMDKNKQMQDMLKLGKQTDLDGAYKDMYANYNRQATVNNNRNIAHAEKLAQQQAALAGYNPALGADYINRSMGSAYDANQQANFDLMQQKDDLLMRQLEENKQKQKEYGDMLMSIDPNLGMRYKSDLLNGVTNGDYSDYIDANGNFKTMSEFDKTMSIEVETLMKLYNIDKPAAEQMYMDNLRTRSKVEQRQFDNDYSVQNLDTMSIEEARDAFKNGEDIFKGKSVEEITKWAKDRGDDYWYENVTNASKKGSMKDSVGNLVTWQGQPYIVESCTKVGYGIGSGYDTKLVNPVTGKTVIIDHKGNVSTGKLDKI